MAIIFSKKDSTWIEAIAAALGVVSNTAAIYLGFSANIRKLHAALVHDQDAQEAQLPHQNWFKRVILWLIGVPNRAVALDLPQPCWWFGDGHAVVQTCWWLFCINILVLTMKIQNIIHTTSLAITVLVLVYSFIASLFLLSLSFQSFGFQYLKMTIVSLFILCEGFATEFVGNPCC